MRWVIGSLTGLLLALAPTTAQDKQPREEKTGPKIGAKAPEFKLKDQKGQERTLSEFLKKGKVALVFFRSASW